MKRAGRTGLTLAAILAVGAAGYWAGHRDLALPTQSFPKSSLQAIPLLGRVASTPASADPAPARPVLYYRDPDSGSTYSAVPRRTDDGRDFLPVYANEDAHDADTPAAVAQAPASGERRHILYYRNPMGLADTSPVAKKDSMGMDYLPVYDGEDSDDGSIKLSPGKLQRTGVKSEAASARVISTTIRAPGTIQFDERRIAVISMRAEAWVEKVENVTTGTAVRKGQPLMRVYNPALTQAAVEYVFGMGKSSDAIALGGGLKQRLLNLAVPEDTIAMIEKSRVAPLTVVWTAPRDGIVIERNVVDGMRAQPGDVLFRLADLSVVWGMVDVSERDLGNLVTGQPVAMRARSYPGRTFTGIVSVIYPQINRETRTARVRIELPNPDIALLPDMYIDAEIDTGSQKPVLSVPDSAVIDTGSRQTVFIDKGQGRLEPRDVKIGARGGGYVEIREGVKNGEAVVDSANFLIDAESNLQAALKGFSEAESSQ
ncbi:MAG: efflux RND transporter periplasmic adaptor subunit [Beijerinckiaceae bacterium]